jgi:hypothetical protein
MGRVGISDDETPVTMTCRADVRSPRCGRSHFCNYCNRGFDMARFSKQSRPKSNVSIPFAAGPARIESLEARQLLSADAFGDTVLHAAMHSAPARVDAGQGFDDARGVAGSERGQSGRQASRRRRPPPAGDSKTNKHLRGPDHQDRSPFQANQQSEISDEDRQRANRFRGQDRPRRRKLHADSFPDVAGWYGGANPQRSNSHRHGGVGIGNRSVVDGRYRRRLVQG